MILNIVTGGYLVPNFLDWSSGKNLKKMYFSSAGYIWLFWALKIEIVIEVF